MSDDLSVTQAAEDTLAASARPSGPTLPSRIAGRYDVGDVLGVGGFGVVVRATDALSSRPLALKLLRGLDAVAIGRIRREVAALRLLRIPGVVELDDDGVDGERYFLAMELVEGSPFPGRPTPVPWADLAPVARALLETLARIHAAAIVHRDLKPSNVLVTAEGRPVVLDFGLAAGPAVGRTITQDGVILGTPAYVSPEEVLGESVGPPADLYALGVMLYDALAGRLPFQGGSARELLMGRVAAAATPLRHVAPSVPPDVADVVDRLLAREPGGRPRSAHAALEALFGRKLEGTGLVLPWLGTRAPVDRALELLRDGHPARLLGPPGSGRTRCLRDAADVLESEGRTVCWVVPASRPFASLDAAVPLEPSWSPLSVAAVADRVDERLRSLLEAGVVLVADDPERLDAWSRAALARAAGAVLSADPHGPGAELRIAPLTEQDLRPLFAGPDRLHHLREDTARELHGRTGGSPARIHEEVSAWVRAGLAAWEGPALSVGRPAIDRLASGVRLVPSWAPAQPRSPSTTRGDGSLRFGEPEAARAHHRELLGWIHVAWPHTSPGVLAAAMGEPLWRVEAEVAELLAMGLAVQVEDGPIALTVAASQTWQRWPEARRRDAHAALADVLEPGTDGRLSHLMAAGELRGIVDEASVLALELRRRGRLGRAAAVLSEGLGAARAHEDAQGEERLLDAWARLALAEGTVAALDRALYEIGRAHPVGPATLRLEILLRAALNARREVGPAVLRRVDALLPFDDAELEGARQEARVRASRAGDVALEDAVLREAEAWAARAATPNAAIQAALWRGMHLYRRGRYAEAAACQLGPSQGSGDALLRLCAMLNAAAALIEDGDARGAMTLAQRARALASTLRHALFEGRAEWIRRTALYRLGLTAGVDHELVEAAQQLRASDVLAQICATEAAAALRAGASDDVVTLARRAEEIWRGMGRPWEPLLMRALVLAGQRHVDEREAHRLAEDATSCPVVGFGIQVLGLLALAKGGPVPEWRPSAARLAAALPAGRWREPLDVLSVEESLSAVVGAPSG